jgi:hypothetical protein
MSKAMCNTLLRCLASAALLLAPACSSDADLAAAVNPNAPGASSSDPQPNSAPGAAAPGPPGAVPPSAADTPGMNPSPSESPATVPLPPGDEPEPNATETNFFSAGCRRDADCGNTRRCQFPPDAGDRVAAPAADAGAGADAGAPEPLTPSGRCVAR